MIKERRFIGLEKDGAETGVTLTKNLGGGR